jgi:hypothetical protein
MQTGIAFSFWVASYFNHRPALQGSTFRSDLS